MVIEIESVELSRPKRAGGPRWEYRIRPVTGDEQKGVLPDADSEWTFSKARKHFVAWAEDYDLDGLTWTEDRPSVWAAVTG